MEQSRILDFIKEQGGSTKEHLLLSFIESNYPDFFSSLGSKPSLFKQHFFLFNHLYKLNEGLIKENHGLIISALEIRVCLVKEDSTEIGRADALKEFYLDEDNLKLSDQEIIQMMQSFWQKYMALDKKSEAIKTLSLENEADLTRRKLKKRYNQLAKLHHPDKGGDEVVFVEIKQAYDELKLLL